MFLNIAHTKHLKLQGLQSTRSPPGPPARTRAPWPAPGFTWYKGAAPPARLSSWYCASRNRLAIMQMQWRHLRGRQLVRLVRALTARCAVVLHLSMQTETEKQSPKQKGTKVILHKMSATTSPVIIGTSSLIHHWPPWLHYIYKIPWKPVNSPTPSDQAFSLLNATAGWKRSPTGSGHCPTLLSEPTRTSLLLRSQPDKKLASNLHFPLAQVPACSRRSPGRFRNSKSPCYCMTKTVPDMQRPVLNVTSERTRN